MNKKNTIYTSDTIVALATASGIGAIAVIRLSGANAIEIADRIFKSYSKKPLINAPSHTVHLGTLEAKNQVLMSVWLLFSKVQNHIQENP